MNNVQIMFVSLIYGINVNDGINRWYWLERTHAVNKNDDSTNTVISSIVSILDKTICRSR